MTDTPAPVFDANGWCHDMSKAPRDRHFEAMHKDSDYPPAKAWFDAEKLRLSHYFISRCGRYIITNPTAWRYPPAPPVGE